MLLLDLESMHLFDGLKEKIKTWEKMKFKLKTRFLPPSYLHDSYSQLYNLTQGTMSAEEYSLGNY